MIVIKIMKLTYMLNDKGWLSVVVSPFVEFFPIAPSTYKSSHIPDTALVERIAIEVLEIEH